MNKAFVGAVLGLSIAAIASAQGNSGRDPKPFRVVDKNAKVVGVALTENLVVREIDGTFVTFTVHPVLGIFDSGAIYVSFATADCTGTRYVPHYTAFSEGVRVGSKLFYPIGQQELTPGSVRVVFADETESACFVAAAIPGSYGEAVTVDVTSFGLEPPFKAVQ
jgi:hypothetical protein